MALPLAEPAPESAWSKPPTDHRSFTHRQRGPLGAAGLVFAFLGVACGAPFQGPALDEGPEDTGPLEGGNGDDAARRKTSEDSGTRPDLGPEDASPSDQGDLADLGQTLDGGPHDAVGLPGARDGGAPGRDAGPHELPLAGQDAGGPPDRGVSTSTTTAGLDARPVNSSCRAPARPQASGVRVRLEQVFLSAGPLTRPLALRPLPGAPGTYWVIEQPGRVLQLGETGPARVLADLTDRVDDGPSEAGLLGFAFHPEFLSNGRVFFSYTARADGQLESRLVELSSPNRNDLDPGSERRILRVSQPAGNHNGGAIEMGPDGHLYFGLGDGGGSNDQFRNGQDPTTLLGSIVRLDVDRPSGSGYSIPPGNPFVSGGGAAEVFAFGFRNPWRFTFDAATGDLWAGDVGQGSIEEIDRVVLGGNYGWNVKEGSACFPPSRPTCDSTGLIDPVIEYAHAEGRSVTGGYVYRGSDIPELVGAYVYGDFVSGSIWSARGDPATGRWRSERLVDSGLPVASFAEDENRELYVLAWSGTLHRIVPAGPPDGGAFPDRLSQTGCVDPSDPTRPAEGLIPYRPNAELWSDGAAKERYVALPPQGTVSIAEDGDFDFPVGTVLLKHFRLGGRYLETRLFVRHEDGGWAGYSYAWRPNQADADLVPSALRLSFDGGTWRIPSRAECLACHTAAAGRSLGLEWGQLDGPVRYPSTGRVANQLDTWSAVGLFSSPVPVGPGRPPRIPRNDEASAPVVDKAKAWLHTNCSICHRPSGTGRSPMDLRFRTPLAEMAVCDVPPTHGDLGLTDAALLAPLDPGRSLLYARPTRLDANRMPPLASEQIDIAGTGRLEAWISSLEGCPP